MAWPVHSTKTRAINEPSQDHSELIAQPEEGMPDFLGNLDVNPPPPASSTLMAYGRQKCTRP